MAASKGLLSKKWIRGLLVGAAAAAIAIVLWATGILDGPENSTWNLRVRMLHEPSAATDDVVVVRIEDADLVDMSEINGIDWPWPRSIQSYIVDFANAAGAATVTFDLVFVDELYGVEDNQALRSAASRLGSAVFGAHLYSPVEGSDGTPRPWPEYVRRPPLTVEGVETISDSTNMTTRYGAGTFPREDVIPPDSVLGYFQQAPDPDGVFRRYQLVEYYMDQPVPALGLAPLLTSGPATLRFDGSWLHLDDRRIPVDRQGRVVLNYTSNWEIPVDEVEPDEQNAYNAFDVVLSGFNLSVGEEPLIPLDAFEGKHVFVAVAAAGLLDLRPTPLSERAPGVIAHATMLDNLLSGEFMRDLPVWATVIMLLVLTMGAAMLATYASGVLAEAGLFVGFVAIVLGLGIGGYLVGFWVPMVVPLVAVVLAVATGNIANYATEGAQKRFIRGAFSQYLSNDVITQLESDPDKLKLGGERRDLTMYFSDVEGFTSISERLEPEQLTALINAYLTPMTDIIQQSAGTIDKYEGDAIIAFWNAPLEFPDHAARGVHAALECQRRLNELNPEFSKVAGTNMKMRIGLNTGPAVVGNMGSHTRFDYTMLGDAVNLAARLESANKQFGTYTMISKNTLDQLGENGDPRPMGFVGTVGEIAVRELGRLVVKGKKEPVTVYEAMTPAELAERRATLDAFGAALRLYYNAEFRQASEAFRAIESEDPAAAKYVQACLPLIDSPPVSWDGRMTLEAK